MILARRLRSWGLVAALALSLGANYTLFLELRDVQRDYREYRLRQQTLEPGVRLPALTGTTGAGTPVTIRFDDPSRRTLLLAFTEYCPYCRTNWPTWTRLMALAKPEHVRVVAVNMAPRIDAAYVEAQGLTRIPLISTLDYATLAAYKIHAVPTTMLIEADGTLVHAWNGVLNEGAIATLEKALRDGPAPRTIAAGSR